jgi:hypothetical protein
VGLPNKFLVAVQIKLPAAVPIKLLAGLEFDLQAPPLVAPTSSPTVSPSASGNGLMISCARSIARHFRPSACPLAPPTRSAPSAKRLGQSSAGPMSRP